MEGVLNFFQTNAPFLIDHKYLLIFVGAVLEGTNSTILAGFLASISSISLWPAFFICLIGEITNGFLWYTVGFYAGAKPIDKWGRKDEKSRKVVEKVEDYFKRYSGRAILIAKVTWSLCIATMITAGSFKYDLKRFSLYNLIGSAIWIPMIFFMGFFFGESYKFLIEYIKNLALIFVFLGGAIALGYIVRMMFRSMYVRSLFITDKIKEFSYKLRDGLEEFLSNGSEEEK
ncbi:MAG: DedA family protein [Candidatus Yanofskybacteria bacterium]|nr:DedA family protein [Candidatus Yanofskybacteria bacterium]